MQHMLSFLSIFQLFFFLIGGANIKVEESATGAILSFPEISDGDLYNITWEVEPAAFGFADYGGTLEAYLVLPQNRSYHLECGSGEPSDLNEYVTYIQSFQGFDALWILVIDRGDCYFATKVYNAERLGAAGVIMLDYKYEGFLIMWEPDDFEHDVTIPSVLLKRIYAEPLMEHLGVRNWDPTDINSTTYPEPMGVGNNSFVITKAVIEWGLPHEDDRVEWEIWTSSNDDRTMEFKKNFKSVALSLDFANDTVFTPHYYILNGEHWKCDSKFPHCGNQCTNQGRYCAVDPERDLDLGISGMDVVQEDLRQLCIWNFTTHGDDPIHNESLWWDYSVLWNDNCFNDTNNEHTFNTACSYRQMETLDYDGRLGLIAYVNNCIETSGGYGYNDSNNTLLEYEVRFRESESIHVLPTFRVNEFMIYGEVDCEIVTEDGCAVLDSICSGFLDGTQPDICYATPAPTPMNCSSRYRDCDGKCYGTKETDRCGSCLETDSDDWNSCVGCNNVTNSGFTYNPCGFCMDPTWENYTTYGQDCRGCDSCCEPEVYAIDACDECLWTGDEDWDGCKGCDGVPFSNATYKCGLCVEPGTTEWKTACAETGTDVPVETILVTGGTVIIDKGGNDSAVSTIALVIGCVAVIIICGAGAIIYKLQKKQKEQSQAFENILKTYSLMDENANAGIRRDDNDGNDGTTQGNRMKKKEKIPTTDELDAEDGMLS